MARAAAARSRAATANGGSSPGPKGGSTDGKEGPDLIALARANGAGVQARMSDPLWALRLGATERELAAAMAAWGGVMEAFAKEVMGSAPPEYTIAGTLVRGLWRGW